MCHRACHIRAQPRSDRRSQGKNREGHGPALRRKEVSQQCAGSRCTSRLASSHPDPGQEKLQVVAGQAQGGRETRPDDQTGGEDIASVGAVGQQRDRNAEGHIEQRQRHTSEKRHAGITKVQFQPDRLEHRGNDVPVGDVDRVDQAHEGQHVPPLDYRGRSYFSQINCGYPHSRKSKVQDIRMQ